MWYLTAVSCTGRATDWPTIHTDWCRHTGLLCYTGRRLWSRSAVDCGTIIDHFVKRSKQALPTTWPTFVVRLDLSKCVNTILILFSVIHSYFGWSVDCLLGAFVHDRQRCRACRWYYLCIRENSAIFILTDVSESHCSALYAMVMSKSHFLDSLAEDLIQTLHCVTKITQLNIFSNSLFTYKA